VKRRIWSARAARHLSEIHGYVSHENPAAADRVLARIIATTERLERHPFSARAGVVLGTRELIVSGLPYVVIYVVTDDSIEIRGVFHTSRDPRSRGCHES
jgi:addiction module RelE/StbE family toxin